jgi:hypothetical protein
MFAKDGLRSGVRQLLVLVVSTLSCQVSTASDFILTDGRAFPGQLWESRAGGAERPIHRREAAANPAYPQAAMKIGQVTVGPDGKIYFVSGLDGYVMHLLDGEHEVLSFEFSGQIRDLDSGGEEHTVYFSVVPTPQNSEPLADGKIYRRDLWAGQPSEAATVRQSDIGGGWWGTFAIQDGKITIATLERPSRLFKLTTAGPEPVFTANRNEIHGLAATGDGAFVFTDGTGKVYRTVDFVTVEPVLEGDQNFTDVAVEQAAATAGR